MIKYLVLISCFLTLNNTIAQSTKFEWAKQEGGPSLDIGEYIATDNAGNVYVIGSFNDTIDFDPGPGVFKLAAVSYDDIFILKLDAAGNFIWAKTIGLSQNIIAKSITVDNAGNVYAGGEFEDSIDFDPGPGTFYLTSKGNYDVFMLKLDVSGNFVWARSMGGNFYDILYATALDTKGDLVLTGPFSGTSDYDPGVGTANITSAGAGDVFVMKMDTSGNFKWVKQIGGISDDVSYALAIGVSDSIYITGNFQRTVDFNPGVGTFNITPAGLDDEFILKLDAAGNFIWAISYGSPGSNGLDVTNIGIDAAGNVYSFGTFYDTVDFDPGSGINNLNPVGIFEYLYVLKIDASGKFKWVSSIAGDYYGIGQSMIIDKEGNSYFTGTFGGTVDFDPSAGNNNVTAKGDYDIYILKLNASGNFEWVNIIGGDALSICVTQTITRNSKGDIYTTGAFSGTVDFNPGSGIFNLACNNSGDIFVNKLSEQSSGIKSKNFNNTATIYPNPTSGIFNIEHSIPTNEMEMEVYNSLGILIYKKTSTDKINTIDLSNQPSGLYVLKLSGKNIAKNTVLIKQ